MKDKIKTVKINKRALNQLEKLKQNTKQHRGEKAMLELVDDFEHTVRQLKKTPKMFEESKSMKGARRALFGKYGAFLYRVYAKLIRVVVIFDTRTDNKY